MPRLMMLGGGNCQLNAVRRAKKMGIDIVLVDYLPHPIAADDAFVHVQESSFDIPACIRTAKEYAVDGVLTVGTDQPVYTTACVCDELNLPMLISKKTAEGATNKKRMKTVMTAAGIPTVAYCFADRTTIPEMLSRLQPPLVVKPIDSQGQRGVYKVPNAKTASGIIPKSLAFSRADQVLVESFYPSDEITVSGWVSDGETTILTVTDRLLFPSARNIGIAIGHRCPSIHMDQYCEICSLTERLVEAFEIREGPIYFQMLIGKEGIRVNEIACRIGGAFEDFLIPFISGFDILNAALNAALGRSVSTADLAKYNFQDVSKRAAVQLLFCAPGKIQTITPLDQIKREPFILDAGVNFLKGNTIPVVEDATARFGHAVIVGENDNDIQNHVDWFYEHFKVTGTDGQPLLRRYYPKNG